MAKGLDKKQAEKAARMLKEGKPFWEVAKALGDDFDWTDVQQFAWESGALSWQGAKKAITNRLNRLPTATTREARELIRDEVSQYVAYLYYAGRELQKRVDAVRKAFE